MKALGFLTTLNLVGMALAPQADAAPCSRQIRKRLSNSRPYYVHMHHDWGTLIAGETYQVVYRRREFAVTGLNRHYGPDHTGRYENGSPWQCAVSLWGAVFIVGDDLIGRHVTYPKLTAEFWLE